MTVNKLKSALAILCVLGFCTAASPRPTHAADGGALVYLDDEVNQCVADCMKGNPANSKDLEECRTKLSSCQSLNDAWRVSYAKLVEKCPKFEAIDKPGPPKPKQPKEPEKTKPVEEKPVVQPVKQIVICDGSAKKSADETYCICEDGVPARLMDHREVKGVKVATCVVTVEAFKKYIDEADERFKGVCKPGMMDKDRFPNVPSEKRAELTSQCEATGVTIYDISLWYRDLVDGKHPLNATSWDWLINKVEGLDKELKKIKADVDAIIAVWCPVLADKPDATIEERCKAEHDRLEALAKKGGRGPFKGGIETTVSPKGSYTHRAGYGTDTATIGGVVGFTGWVDDQNGVRVEGIVGFGANEDSQRLTVGPEVAYLHAFDKDKTVSLVLGPQGTVEPNDAGSDASNLGGKIGLNIRPAPHFFLEPELVMGASKAVPFVNGIRTPSGAEWAFAIQPGLAAGFQF